MDSSRKFTAHDGTLAEHRVLICDRDAKWTHAIRDQLAASGVRVVQTPYRVPNANAHADRFVRSIKEECFCFSRLGLRRTYPSWAHEKGVPGKVIAQLMGHTKVDTTLNVYAQVDVRSESTC